MTAQLEVDGGGGWRGSRRLAVLPPSFGGFEQMLEPRGGVSV